MFFFLEKVRNQPGLLEGEVAGMVGFVLTSRNLRHVNLYNSPHSHMVARIFMQAEPPGSLSTDSTHEDES
jgi:hypothetical protein